MEVDSGSMLRIVQCLMAFLVLGPVIVTLANGKFHAIEKLHIRTLIHLGNENLNGLLDVVARHSIDCAPEPTGALGVAVAPWQTESLAKSAVVHEAHGRHVTLLDAAATRAEVDSPTYLGGLWHHDGVVMLDPARLAWGLLRVAKALGVRFFENTPARSIEAAQGAESTTVRIRPDGGEVDASNAVVATNA